MRKPKSKDDWWYTRLVNAEPKKIYRECPCCGMRTGIPEIYPTQYCYMCGKVIYRDEERNNQEKKKYEFIRKLKKEGIEINGNNKKTNRRKKISKEI